MYVVLKGNVGYENPRENLIFKPRKEKTVVAPVRHQDSKKNKERRNLINIGEERTQGSFSNGLLYRLDI